MQSVSFNVHSIDELKTAFSTRITNDFSPTVGIVFSSKKHDFHQIASVFNSFNVQLMGCSTAGEICNDEVVDESISVMLLDLKKTNFKVFMGQNSEEKDTYQVAFDLGKTAVEAFENPALIVLSGGMQVVAENILKGVKDAVGKDIPFYGGLAGDDASWVRTFVFDNEHVSDFGLIALIVDHDMVEVKGMATSGWEPIGLENIITEAEGNTIYTINDEPALDVFIRYFGKVDSTMVKGEDVSTLSAQYPLQILRENGDTVLRSPIIGDDEKRSLTLAGYIKSGERFRFSISPGFDVIEKTIDNFGGFRQKAGSAEALILISCKGRHAAFGPMLEDEVSGIYKHWGNTPMIGFLSYGEIGNMADGKCEFHNETCSLVTIKER